LCEEKFSSKKQMEKLSEEIDDIEMQIGISDDERQRSQVEIEVHCDDDTGSELTISYFTHSAGWTPYYDLRVKDVENPVSISSKAMVYQSTGEDWNSVPLILSTGNPSLGGDVPVLRPWYIDFYEPFNEMPISAKAMKRVDAFNSEMVCDELAECSYKMEVPVAAQSESMTSVEYTLPVPYSIPSSGNGRSVDILTNSVPAEYLYKSVRKLEKDVFLLAELKNWESLNLIAGSANIFFEDKYVGAGFIDPRKTEEGLRISLGRDKNILVTRVKGKDFTEKSMMGTSTKVSREWVLTVKNLRKQKINMILEDQIPVSTNKSITVDAVTISGAEHDKDKGKLEWKLTLAPAESKTLPVKYVVTYPKGKTVLLE
jgi:uncharacterized protein (TIGR02231 family)